MLSAICFNLDQSKILSSCNGLIPFLCHELTIQTDSQHCSNFSGTMKIYVGGQQPNQEKTVGSNVLSSTFKIIGKDKYLGKY